MDFCLALKKEEKDKEKKLNPAFYTVCVRGCVCARVRMGVFTGISLHMHRVGLYTDNSSMSAIFGKTRCLKSKICTNKTFFRGIVALRGD